MSSQTGIQQAVAVFDNSPTKLAAAIGNGVLRQHVEHWLATGRVPADKCADVAAASGVRIDLLNEKVDWPMVRKLLGKVPEAAPATKPKARHAHFKKPAPQMEGT